MVLTDYLNALRRGWLIVLVAIVVGVILSSLYTLRAPLEFNSDSAILISSVGSGSPQDRQAGDSFASARAATYAALATSQDVLQPAAEQLSQLSWQDLRARVTAVVQDGTSVIELRAVDTTAAAAASEADAVTSSLTDRIETLEAAPSDSEAAGLGRFEARVIQQPQPAAVALFPQPRNNLLAGLVAGIVVGVTVALVRGSLVAVVADSRRLPRRERSFDLTLGSRRGGRGSRRRRRAALLVRVLERRLGPKWAVVLVDASSGGAALRLAELLAANSAVDGPTLVLGSQKTERGPQSPFPRGEIVSGGSGQADRLEVGGDELSSVADGWDALVSSYSRVLVACSSEVAAADLVRLLSKTDLVLIAATRNTTRVSDLRSVTSDLELLGAEQVLTVLDER